MSEKEIILTKDGYSKLLEERGHLEHTRRREVALRIKEATEFGDLSENSEYDDAKNEQAFVEGRIIQINDMLSMARIIDENGHSNKVSVGAHVVLLDIEFEEEQEYQIVGSFEADPTNHKISNESPVGKAIMGKKAGDVVQVSLPEGFCEYKIVKIRHNNNKK